MARAKRWTIPFMSLNGTDCRVDIYDEGWSGGVTELSINNPTAPGYAADDPFYYEEDADESLLKVIRVKTGYLRLIELSYGSLIDLYPETDTEHYTEFYYGSRLDFTGYMQAQAFENDWVACPRLLSFPIQSPLGLLGQLKFSPSSTFTTISFATGITEVMNRLNAAYTNYLLPSGCNEYFVSYLLSPFNSSPDKLNGSDVFDPMTYQDFLTGVCNMFGLVLHDTPDYLIFSKFEYAGIYTGSSLSFDSGVVDSIDDHFTIASANGKDSIIRPLGKITVNYSGEELFKRTVSIERMVCASLSVINLWEGTPTFFGAGVAWMKMFAPEFYSGSMLSDNDLTNALVPTDKGVIGASIGNKGCVVVYCNSHMSDPSAEILWWRIPMYPGFVGTGHLIIRLNVTKHTMIQDQGESAQPFRISIDVDGEYYDDTDLIFDSTVNKYSVPPSGNFWVKCNVPENGNLMTIKLWGSAAISDGDLYTIDSFSVELQPEKLYQYKEEYKDERVIELEAQSPDEDSVDMIFSRDKFNTHSVLYAGSAGYTPPAYPYLALAQNRLVMDFNGTLPDFTDLYLYKWAYWISGWRWRIIAMSFHPWNDKYNLTMHRSSTIE